MQDSYLFPARRDFIKTGAAVVAAGALGTSANAKDFPVMLGQGKVQFELDPTWGKLPMGMKYGLGCAIVVDSKDRIIVTSRSTNPCVAIFDVAGKLLETWSKELEPMIGYNPDQISATAHGLYCAKEEKGEFLYWTENVAPGKDGKKIGARVYKTDMQGKVLYTFGPAEQATATSQPLPLTNPTDVAVAPNGDIYIVDGYGSQMVYRFDKNFKQLKVIGGRQAPTPKGEKPAPAEHGKFNTCHGVWVSTLRKEPEVYIADRANNRIEIFDTELTYKRTITGVRNPCCFYQHDGLIYVPELDQRVTVLDAEDKVVALLGDGHGGGNKKLDRKDVEANPGKFFTPHALTLDSKGNLYVLEWIDFGRVRKFAKVAVGYLY
jgi:peptidylamidoglycolate lyase